MTDGLAQFTVAPQFKKAMVAVARGLWPENEVQVLYGAPGTYQADDIVGFTRCVSEQEPATLGTNRSREERLVLTVLVSVYRGGGQDMEEVASDRAYDLLRDLEHYVRVTDTTLGGLVRHCFMESHESAGETDPRVIAAGRTIEISAQFVAHARVTRL